MDSLRDSLHLIRDSLPWQCSATVMDSLRDSLRHGSHTRNSNDEFDVIDDKVLFSINHQLRDILPFPFPLP